MATQRKTADIYTTSEQFALELASYFSRSLDIDFEDDAPGSELEEALYHIDTVPWQEARRFLQRKDALLGTPSYEARASDTGTFLRLRVHEPGKGPKILMHPRAIDRYIERCRKLG